MLIDSLVERLEARMEALERETHLASAVSPNREDGAATPESGDQAAEVKPNETAPTSRSLIVGKGMRYLASIGRLEIVSDDEVRVVGRLRT